MSKKPIFNIVTQKAENDIINISGNYHSRNLNVSLDSSPESISSLINSLNNEIKGLEMSKEDKDNVEKHLKKATIELRDKNPDKQSIANSIAQTNQILKETKIAGESLRDIGVLVSQIALWLGTTSSHLGWIH